MAYPYDNDDDTGYGNLFYSEAQMREKMRYAIEGDPDEDSDDAFFDSVDNLDESEDEDWD